METTKILFDKIKEFEGCRLQAYQDAARVWTIGYGHTKGVRRGDRITQEQAVRLMLFHLCIAIDIYRHMTQAEKNKAGYWYREKLKNSFSITGFLKERRKERKRKRDKKISPLHPSYKEESGVEEKARYSHTHAKGDILSLEDEMKKRSDKFFHECMSFKGKYDEQLLMDFYAYWKMPNRKTWRMRFEDEEYWDTEAQIYKFVNNPIAKAKTAADIKLKRTKGKKSAPMAVNTQELQAVAAERAEANARLEREIAERKAGAVPYEEYLKMKNEEQL
jgi:hypothetical protein